MNLTEYWQTLNQHSDWNLEWYNSSLLEWISVKSDLTVQRRYSVPETCKITLLFNASQSGDYRLTFGIDLRVKRYVQKLDQYQYELIYEGVSVIFDWSDVIGIGGLVVTHGVKDIDGNDYFWCRMQRDNVPQGAYLEIDPSLNITLLSKETYYPSNYILTASTTLVSGSVSNLQADDGIYATFRSYASTNGTGVLGSSTASTTGSTTIEAQIVGSLFTPTSSGWLSNIMAYVGVTTAAKLGGAALYRHNDLAWIANTSVVSLGVATSWRTFTFAQPYPAVIAGTDYILVAWCATGSGNGLLYYGTGVANQGHIDPQTWGAWPNPLVPTTHNAFNYDINASMIVPSEYTCEVEFTGTSNMETWLEATWGVDCSFTTDSVAATFQFYNYQTLSYPQSGDGFMSHTIGNVDVNKTQTVTINPSNFKDTSGNWKVKVKAVKATNVQFDLKADFVDPTVIFTAVSVTSVHTCPLDTHTFVIAYSDDTNDDFSFQIYDTNGTQVLAETDVDTTSGGSMDYTSVGVSAFNSTTFVIGWFDLTDADATFAIYNKTGSLLSGPTDVDTNVYLYGQSVQVSCFNSTHFVIGWFDSYDEVAIFAVYTSGSVLKAGPTTVDATAGSACSSVSVSAFDSTHFVIGWNDNAATDAVFAVYYSNGTLITGPTIVDNSVGDSRSVSVSALDSTHFVIGFNDYADQDATFAVYYSNGTLMTGPTDADTAVGIYCSSVQVSALNSTAFVISWYNNNGAFDLTYATYLSDGTVVAALTDIESWPTATNAPFRYQSPCSQESATGIELYGDNWIIAYANTTTQAVWQAFTPAGAAWDGTIPSGVNTNPWFFGSIPFILSLAFKKSPSWNIQGTIQLAVNGFNVNGLMSYIEQNFLNAFGNIPFAFLTEIQRSISFSRQGVVPLSFNVASIYARLASILNFFGNIPFNFVTGLQNALSFTRQGVASLNFLTGTQRALTLNRENSIPLAFNMLSKYGQARSLAFLGNIVFQFAEAFQKAVSITYSSAIPLSFTISTLYSQVVQNFLYFFGNIPVNFAVNLQRIISFNVQGTVPLTFIMNSAYSRLATLLNLFGTVVFNFAINMAKTFGFNIFSTETLAFTVASLSTIIGIPVLLYLFGIIPLAFTIASFTPFSIPTAADIALALGAVAFVLAVTAIAFTVIRRRREE
jgi:hypothetical protein